MTSLFFRTLLLFLILIGFNIAMILTLLKMSFNSRTLLIFETNAVIFWLEFTMFVLTTILALVSVLELISKRRQK